MTSKTCSRETVGKFSRNYYSHFVTWSICILGFYLFSKQAVGNFHASNLGTFVAQYARFTSQQKGSPHMSEIKLNLLDSHTTIIATVHGSVGDALVAALSAEPETIDELEAALMRFQKCTSIPASSLYRSERCEIDETPYDAGILVIDLAARMVSCESTYSLPGPRGAVYYHDGTQCTEILIEYQLSDDWIFLRSIEEYQERAASARPNTRANT